MKNTITVKHEGSYRCTGCKTMMLDESETTVKCIMMHCENYGISWYLPSVVLTRVVKIRD